MGLKVEFKTSGKTVEWDDSFESILELGEENGIELENECRMGVCGTCKVKLLSGEVDMEEETGLDDADRDENMILLCVATPKTDVVIDA
ncbi:MAG: 2Fe-2S iron-sulfur cluster binding domain-containing protein [Deltaproteobacteria bacterium]|nr:2Fe-2S iron-sulfur cluster binding domain-containing protein [Deltaproteobacteria bacterium]